MEFEYKTLFDLKKVVQNYNLKLTGILFRFVFLFQLPNMSENVQSKRGNGGPFKARIIIDSFYKKRYEL